MSLADDIAEALERAAGELEGVATFDAEIEELESTLRAARAGRAPEVTPEELPEIRAELRELHAARTQAKREIRGILERAGREARALLRG